MLGLGAARAGRRRPSSTGDCHADTARQRLHCGAMPIYEYACMECEEHFEELVRSAEQVVTCPSCGAAKVVKQLSSFAVHGATPTPSFSGPSVGAAAAAAAAAAATSASLRSAPARPAAPARARGTAPPSRRDCPPRESPSAGARTLDAPWMPSRAPSPPCPRCRDCRLHGVRPRRDARRGRRGSGSARRRSDARRRGAGVPRGARRERRSRARRARSSSGCSGEIGIEPDDVYVTTVLKCRPPGEPRSATGGGRRLRAPPLPPDRARPSRRSSPRSGPSRRSCCPGRSHGITRVHGEPQSVSVGSCRATVLPLYNPAAALYTPTMLRRPRGGRRAAPGSALRARRLPRARGRSSPRRSPQLDAAGARPRPTSAADVVQLGLF